MKSYVRGLSIAFAMLFALAMSAGVNASTCADSAPPPMDDGWKTAAPGELGMTAAVLCEMTAAVTQGHWGNVHAVLIERKGALIYEAYFSGPDELWGSPRGTIAFDRQEKHDLRSISKAVTSTLIGIAIQEGHIKSVDAPIYTLLPKFSQSLGGRKRSITLKHLLTMTSGLEWDEGSVPYSDARNDERRMSASDDPIAFVLGRKLAAEPGTVFNYSGGSTQVLAAIILATTGMPVDAYAKRVLFGPLQITDFEWLGDLDGMPSAASGLRLRARDLAKIGSVFLNAGRWKDQQIVPAQWVIDATRLHLDSPAYIGRTYPPFVLRGGYGYQWWYQQLKTPVGDLVFAAALGNGNQRVLVIPQLEMAITLFGGFYNDGTRSWLPHELVFSFVLPALVNK